MDSPPVLQAAQLRRRKLLSRALLVLAALAALFAALSLFKGLGAKPVPGASDFNAQFQAAASAALISNGISALLGAGLLGALAWWLGRSPKTETQR